MEFQRLARFAAVAVLGIPVLACTDYSFHDITGIIVEIKDEDNGGRGFSCYDLEGHLWSFGTYDPWR